LTTVVFVTVVTVCCPPSHAQHLPAVEVVVIVVVSLL
jgi:hypothetical protein